MGMTSDNPDDIHAIAFHEEFIQPNPLHGVNQDTHSLQILHSKKGGKMQGSGAAPGTY